MGQTLLKMIVDPVVKFAYNFIIKHVVYITCSTKHVNKMRKKLEVLKNTSTDVEKHMEKNVTNGREVPAGVPDWLVDVKNLMTNVSTGGIGCLNLKERYRAGKKACEDAETIDELIAKKSGFDWTDALIPTGIPLNPIPTSSSSSSGGEVFKSRDIPFNVALKFLQQDDNKSCHVIALCGMGGVGKTTMMNQLEGVAIDKKMFYRIVKVVIGRTPDMLSIQNDISIRLGGEGLLEKTKEERGESLCRKFKGILQDGEKKILILLDDVWEKIELKYIGLTGPLAGGLKLILTSRNVNVCRQIAADIDSILHEVRVDVLEKSEAQNFFSQITGVSRENNRNKYLKGCDIVQECGNLPLAIQIIASNLKRENENVWDDTLTRLKNNMLDDNVQEIIRMSYEYILKDEAKSIFLHCSLFPEDFDIPIEDLTKHAWGLELFTNVSTLKEARNRTYTCVRDLVNASLLIYSDRIGCVKVHDLVHAFLLGTVSKVDHAWIVNHTGDISHWDIGRIGTSCKGISITCRGVSHFPTDSKYPNLSLLQIMDGDQSLKFPMDFYEDMKNLKILSYYNMEYPFLPRSLQCSTNLKTLYLDKCKLMFDCSFVGDLVNLEVLSFAHCGIRKVPSTIRKLIKLKLLDLTGCVDLLIDDGAFETLKNLEELYMRVSLSKAIRFTDANFKDLRMLLSKLHALEVEFVKKKTQLSFKNLDKFKISIGCCLDQQKNEKHSFKNTLKLMTDESNFLRDCEIGDLFKKTRKLHLQVKDMTCLKDVVSQNPYDQDLFFYLRELVVYDCPKLIHLFPISVAIGLRKLERLKISSCSVLKSIVPKGESEITSIGEEVIKFDKLKFLCLQKLPKLEHLFDVDNIVELPELVELEVDGLPNFTSIFYHESNIISESHQRLLNSQVSISQLKKLKVKSMDKLSQIWACSSEEEVKNISMLKEIEVKGCVSLVNLFPTNPIRILKHLEWLIVKKCDSIVVIFNIDLGCTVGYEVGKSSSLRSIRVEDSEKLREVWRIKGGENKWNSSILGFEALESINIKGCPGYSIYHGGETWRNEDLQVNVIPTFPHHLSNLSMRESKRVKVRRYGEDDSCMEVWQLDVQQQMPVLPFLQDLRLQDMEWMTHVWKCGNWNKFLLHPQSSFHSLTTITIDTCNRIKYLFSPLMATLLSNLQNIHISQCEGMEEIVSNRDDKDDEETTTSTTNLFPHLHYLYFGHLPNLKRIGGYELKFSQVGVGSWSLCQYPRKISILSCDALSSAIPSFAVGKMQNLQELVIWWCKSLIEVFGSEETNNNNNVGSSTVPSLESINSVPQLSNLKKLEIISCDLLQHVFTFSTLDSLRLLEELRIERCNAMKVIVKEENEEQITKVVMFPHLKSLELVDLPNLEGFFLGKNDFQWPSLEKFTIDSCPQMMVFTSGWSTTPKLKYLHTRLGKHSLETVLINFHMTTTDQLPTSESTSLSSATLEEVPVASFHNLIEIDMKHRYDNWNFSNIIPSNELLQLQKLERIRLFDCGFEEVFDEPQTVVEVPNLRQLELVLLPFLKSIWKSNNHYALKFPNLTTLYINRCSSLEHVFTSSMVGSLLQLQDLDISSCDRLTVIVKEEESEFEDGAKVKEIVKLPCLKSLRLEGLDSLRGFCLGEDDFLFPLLDTLEITRCRKLTVFTKGHVDTPTLNVIDTGFGMCHIKEDLNSFIRTKQQEGFQF